MEYTELIKNWHSKAGNEEYFSKFVFEYLAFIAHLRKNLFKNAGHDRTAIQELKQDSEIKTEYLEKIKSDKNLKAYWQKIKDEFNREPLTNESQWIDETNKWDNWWNCSHNKKNQKTTEEKNKENGVIHSLSDWENMIEFWYIIRNNLFHGEKDSARKRDKFGVEYGYLTLRPLVEILIKNA